MTLELVKPSLAYLPGCKDALERGWSPDHLNSEKRRLVELAQIATDPAGFLDDLNTNREGQTVTLLDGTQVRRLPGHVRWIWDGEFCGRINFRWQLDGTPNLPPTCLGHIGSGFCIVMVPAMFPPPPTAILAPSPRRDA